jgi:hypothetical protein
MHLRPDHAVRDVPTLHAFIEQHPLGVLTTSLPSEDHPILQCSHIPWVLDSETSPESDLASQSNQTHNENTAPPNRSKGVLHGHIARQNPQSKAMVESDLNNSTKTPSIPGAISYELRRRTATISSHPARRSPNRLHQPDRPLHHPKLLHRVQACHRKSCSDLELRRRPSLRPGDNLPRQHGPADRTVPPATAE